MLTAAQLVSGSLDTGSCDSTEFGQRMMDRMLNVPEHKVSDDTVVGVGHRLPLSQGQQTDRQTGDRANSSLCSDASVSAHRLGCLVHPGAERNAGTSQPNPGQKAKCGGPKSKEAADTRHRTPRGKLCGRAARCHCGESTAFNAKRRANVA